jgi:dihydroneopterin aldolase
MDEMDAMDCILVSNLELRAHIGITPEERGEAQRLTVSLKITPLADFTALGDDIARTVDYFRVSRRIQEIAMDRPRNLIETLAGEIAGTILEEFAASRVEVELRKYILPDAEYVAVRVTRPKMEPFGSA